MAVSYSRTVFEAECEQDIAESLKNTQKRLRFRKIVVKASWNL